MFNLAANLHLSALSLQQVSACQQLAAHTFFWVSPYIAFEDSLTSHLHNIIRAVLEDTEQLFQAEAGVLPEKVSRYNPSAHRCAPQTCWLTATFACNSKLHEENSSLHEAFTYILSDDT